MSSASGWLTGPSTDSTSTDWVRTGARPITSPSGAMMPDTPLVAATTTVRLFTFLVYRANAYRVFPGLSIRPAYFKMARLREITAQVVGGGL